VPPRWAPAFSPPCRAGRRPPASSSPHRAAAPGARTLSRAGRRPPASFPLLRRADLLPSLPRSAGPGASHQPLPLPSSPRWTPGAGLLSAAVTGDGEVPIRIQAARATRRTRAGWPRGPHPSAGRRSPSVGRWSPVAGLRSPASSPVVRRCSPADKGHFRLFTFIYLK
jgi:hypothetical protein